MEDLIKRLNDLREKFSAEYVKVYLINENDFCIKLIKAGAIIKCFRVKPKYDMEKTKELLKGLR